MPEPDPALSIDGLSVRLGGRTILSEVELRVEPGRLTALLGPNGAGKTTLIRCCTGLITPDGGRISVLGAAPGTPTALAGVGMMPQSTGAWSGVRPGELLRYLSSLYGEPLDPAALQARLGIDAYARIPYRRLSGGQQQAVNLAGALIGRPKLIFLDEPTAGMDPHARRATWGLLRELRTAGVAILLTTHAMEEAEALADHVSILDGGVIKIAGTVAELTADGASLEEIFLSSTHPGTP
ncbi:ABC transporter ATP-binding protein [Microlunatus sp. GCM10028923]|uniref:ABC transporter ATP-binding protein n=1 Tax=Microlunatus sp. GCM10028923 TaxID=3273400 RepID=UPI00360BAAC7